MRIENSSVYATVFSRIQEKTVESSEKVPFVLVLKCSKFRKSQVAAQPRPSVHPTTWCFDLALQLPTFSAAEDVCLVFLAIRKDVQDNQAIPGSQDFSY